MMDAINVIINGAQKSMYGKFWKNYMESIGMSGDAVGYHNILTH